MFLLTDCFRGNLFFNRQARNLRKTVNYQQLTPLYTILIKERHNTIEHLNPYRSLNIYKPKIGAHVFSVTVLYYPVLHRNRASPK